MKLTDIMITSIIKKGFLYEAVNVDTEIEIPMAATDGESSKNIVVRFKADRMSLKIDKSE